MPAIRLWVLLIPLLPLAGFFSSRILAVRTATPPQSAGVGGTWSVLYQVSLRPQLFSGFRNLLADLAWLEGVQVAGNRKMTSDEYSRLFDLLNMVSNFDPKFEIPYLLGGLVLGQSPDHGREALAVLERGRANHRSDWRFPYYMGFISYFSLGNPQTGGRAMGEAAKMAGSPLYLAGLASRMLSEAREPGTALALLETMVAQEGDAARRSVLERRLREVVVERDLQLLEKAVETYRGKTGTVPGELSDLVRAGILRGIPSEPGGGIYLLDSGGKVRSSRSSQRLQVFRQR